MFSSFKDVREFFFLIETHGKWNMNLWYFLATWHSTYEKKIKTDFFFFLINDFLLRITSQMLSINSRSIEKNSFLFINQNDGS